MKVCIPESGDRQVPVAALTVQKKANRSPRSGAFLRLVLGGYTLATWCKTLYRWLHGGYMTRKTKNPATYSIAGFPCIAWWVVQDSNLRPTD